MKNSIAVPMTSLSQPQNSPNPCVNPCVSVIMPVYNAANFLSAALESALKQTFEDFEIIVVDDGSTDGTRELLQTFEQNFEPRVRVLRQANAGASSARNTAIRAARGEFIAFLDSDDLWEPQKLELQVAALRERPEAGVCFGESLYFDEEKSWDANFKDRAPAFGMIFKLLLTEHIIAMSSVMVRKSCLDEVGLFDESLIGCEDYNLYLRLAQRFPFRFLAQPLTHLRCHEASLSNDLVQMRRDEIANVEKIAALFPDMAIPQRRLCAQISFRFGQYHFDRHEFAVARACFARSLHYAPLRVGAYVYLAAALLPDSTRHLLRNALRALRGAGRTHAES